MFDAGPLIREAQYQTFRKLRDAGDPTIGYASSFDFRKSWYKDARLTLERMEPQFLTDQEAWTKEKAKQREKARAGTPK